MTKEKIQENIQKDIKLSKEQIDKLNDVLGKEMVNELIEMVYKIENGVPTTKNHYGQYMVVLNRFNNNKILIGNLLILMGANKQGIMDALKLL